MVPGPIDVTADINRAAGAATPGIKRKSKSFAGERKRRRQKDRHRRRAVSGPQMDTAIANGGLAVAPLVKSGRGFLKTGVTEKIGA